ncbi:hypothetical protein MKW98_021366 [Papaver atlanticum]|uniref:Uncharacterized protein n=1 Tax=Papaver atlanticum TaxID=357466 RepID=A0AAD4XJ57_9MAGN|nr:hypothetical protein MKW98_021366 [Papaver atlanticum]
MEVFPNGMNHKRGNSLDGGQVTKEKDDDLALFNHMEMKEEDKFLLEPNDDLDESFSTKLRHFSTSKPGTTIPVRGESIDLLSGEGDKHDYDWLLTPPGSPVSTSLDNEASLETFSRVGRPRGQPLSTSRSFRAEKGYRNYRSSASPHRLSPSPISQARGRPSSASGGASRASSTPSSRAKTHSPSYPRNKPSTPPLEIPPQTFQRTSLSLSKTSQEKTRRGGSPSPKFRTWQFDNPDFSLKTPPNLRTSIADRPTSYVRGSSPVSRSGRRLSPASINGRGLSPSSKSDKGSPSTSRSERGSSPASMKECGTPPASRNGIDSSPRYWRQSMSPTASRSVSSVYSHDGDQSSPYSKCSMASSGDDDIDSLQSVSISSSPLSIRKVGIFPHKKKTTFSKTFSRTPSPGFAPENSSYSALRKTDKKTSQAMCRPLLLSAPNTAFYVEKENSSYQYHHMNSKNSSVVTSSDPSSEHVDVIDLYKDDHAKCGEETNNDSHDEVNKMNENVEIDIHNPKMNLALWDEIEGITCEVSPCETENLSHQKADVVSASISSSLNIENLDCHKNETPCYKCGKKFYVVVLIEDNNGICQDCNETDVCISLSTKVIPGVDLRHIDVHFQVELVKDKSLNELVPEVEVPKLTKLKTMIEPLIVTGEINGKSCLLSNSFTRSIMEEGENHLVNKEEVGQIVVGADHDRDKQSLHNTEDLSMEMVVSGDVETQITEKLSCKKAKVENSENDLIINHSRRDLSSSEYLDHSYQNSIHRMSTAEGIFDASAENVEHLAFEETQYFSEQRKETIRGDSKPSFTDNFFFEKENKILSESGRTLDSSVAELSNYTLSIHSGDAISIGVSTDLGYSMSSESLENFRNKTMSSLSVAETFCILEHARVESCVDNDHDRREDPTHGGLVTVFKELETANESMLGFQIDCVDSLNAKCSLDVFDKHSVISTLEKDDSIAPAGCPKQEIKNMCVEAATTDTLPLCSSIVHNLAYQATSIATEQEKLIHVDDYWTTVTSFGKTCYNEKDSHVTTINNPSLNSMKKMQKVEIEDKSLSTKKSSSINTSIESQEPMKNTETVTNKGDIIIPKKVEAKCSCIVM